MPTLKELDEARKSNINSHRIFWEKVDAIRRPALGFLELHDAGPKTEAMNKIILDALNRLRETMYEIVGCQE